MPIYEYRCDDCAYRFEIKQSMKDDPLTDCPRCGKPVKRLISSPAIMFKGSGWYVTDYSEKMKPSPGSEQPVAKSEEKKETTPSTSEQTTSTAPATPASPPSTVPASTPSSTNSSSSNTATTAPSSSTTKKAAETKAR